MSISPRLSPKTAPLPQPSPFTLDDTGPDEPFDVFHLRELEAMGIDTCPIGPPRTGWFDFNPDEMEERLERLIWRLIAFWVFLIMYLSNIEYAKSQLF
ncbi:hypothetical protein DM02DRAFT_655888 [Periconia macrospinosa]|uniref:Uncharacterized protein n=1 Tax=Periconia macrospinosa TaxID=97972 RepID=A0A2V1DPM0_9PLEO|nr:hypothetical protein DM02DRAFT_655888 [Periconia macrospinosa]